MEAPGSKRRDGDDGAHHPPAAVPAPEERRLQARAYNHWASLLRGRAMPALGDLDLSASGGFARHSAVFEVSAGGGDFAVHCLGDQLAAECAAPAPLERASEAPAGSALASLAARAFAVLVSKSPLGFEDELPRPGGGALLCRGVLLPFRDGGASGEVSHVWGAINWREVADRRTARALRRELHRALAGDAALAREPPPITDWADGPAAEAASVAPAPADGDRALWEGGGGA